jgi:hypothetical protein
VKDIDEYEDSLNSKLDGWSPKQRCAFAAAMAERWFPTYEKFSAAEKWGDAKALRRILDAIWGHVLDRPITAADRRRYASQVDANTPHMDDFDDADAALAACAMLGEALDTCAWPDKPRTAGGTAISGFHAVIPDFDSDPDEQPRLWRKAAAQNELKKQLKLIEQIDALTSFDDKAITTLRKASTSAALIGNTSAAKSSAPKGWTNQAAFEQYRVTVTADLKQTPWQPPPGMPFMFSITTLAPWGARYRRRLDIIRSTSVDALGHEAVVARNIAHDAANKTLPMWDKETRESIDIAYPNTFLDVKSVEQPHGYGPSLRRLWLEAKQLGNTDEQASASIQQWSRHVPAAWAIEDQRKKKGLAYVNAALGEHLAKPLTWNRSGDLDHPWESETDGATWRVRINDFPDEIMYTLLINDDEIGPFHDWPANWRRI